MRRPLLVLFLLLWACQLVLAQVKAPPLPKVEAKTDTKTNKGDPEAGLVLCGLSGAALFIAGGSALVVSLLFGFLPTVVAIKRGHPNLAPIVAVNLLLGWTFIGWVVALVWSLTAFEQPRYRRRSAPDDFE